MKAPAPTRSIRLLEAALAAALDDVHDITIALERLRAPAAPATQPAEAWHCPCKRRFTRYPSFVAHMDARHVGDPVPPRTRPLKVVQE